MILASSLAMLLIFSILIDKAPAGKTQLLASIEQQRSTTIEKIISGSYTGTIAIDKPLALGILDISLAITDTNGNLSGRLDNSGSLAFPSSAALSGSITGKVNGITPTFRIDAAPFSSIVSGRNVTRSFRMDGTVEEDGNVIRGIYTETINGFTPNPLIVNGKFLASRAALASASGVPGATATPVGPTATPTKTGPTPTRTSTPVPGSNKKVYLPVVSNQRAVNVDVAEENLETPTPESTPMPSEEQQGTGQQSELSPEATATSEYNLYLPSVVRN